jgi:hypothetical protein
MLLSLPLLPVYIRAVGIKYHEALVQILFTSIQTPSGLQIPQVQLTPEGTTLEKRSLHLETLGKGFAEIETLTFYR